MATDEDEVEDEVSPHVHVKIGKGKKSKWLKYAQKHHRGNLSTLVVDAVDKTISGDWVFREENDDAETGTIDVDLSSVNEDIADLKSQTSTILGKLDGMVVGEDAGGGIRELNRDELLSLSNLIKDALPVIAGDMELSDLKAHTQPTDRERSKITGKVEDLVLRLERHPYHVREAAIFLEAEERNVHSIIDDGERRWYVQRPDHSGEDYDTAFKTAKEVDEEEQANES
ncbi:hypothetical protein NDI85_09495 [Halomicroarcula sp. S1AR25-4]|uniref:hypothetical protein n=1 Tax=Haloarcula sp. S1AR25-4 TaxID=2950538 RepID=UPI0028761A17|nr:hypothetical protein [Halomicroarcula sp. S1AR25-4]MDS0278029.1 hypothetical protein [Halomicroarcula sp. S1AR25-4]